MILLGLACITGGSHEESCCNFLASSAYLDHCKSALTGKVKEGPEAASTPLNIQSRNEETWNMLQGSANGKLDGLLTRLRRGELAVYHNLIY